MSRWPNKYVIGLTGNIAVGKSVVRQMLQHLGAYTIDADGLSHQAMAPGAPAYAPVVEMFGRFILDEEGKINRNILGSIVFSYPEALAKLEAIVHPVVIQATNTLVTRAKQSMIVIEAIKLLETDLAEAVDSVWVVDAAPETQLKRLMEKRGMSADEARKRIAAQRPQLEKIKKADHIINNDGNVEETWKQVQAAWNEIRTRTGRTGQTGQLIAPATTQPIPPTRVQPTQPIRPAAPPPPPTAAQAAVAPAAPTGTLQVTVRRGMPGNADMIARFISRVSGRQIDRMDIMMAFGQKSYLLAQDQQDNVVAVMGWQVENLITRADEFYLEQSVPRAPVVNALVTAIEDASKELQSEVGFIFLSPETPTDVIQAFLNNGYESTTVEEIRVSTWREAVHEIVKPNQRILTKKLRPDRVMKPI